MRCAPTPKIVVCDNQPWTVLFQYDDRIRDNLRGIVSTTSQWVGAHGPVCYYQMRQSWNLRSVLNRARGQPHARDHPRHRPPDVDHRRAPRHPGRVRFLRARRPPPGCPAAPARAIYLPARQMASARQSWRHHAGCPASRPGSSAAQSSRRRECPSNQGERPLTGQTGPGHRDY